MAGLLKVTGIVLQTSPIGEDDRRVVLLTKERGKITAFAKGARRQNSPLQAACRPFSFGKFTVFEGRNSYTMRSAAISNYFEFLSTQTELVCYASYFVEFANYYARENNDESQLLLLLYQSFRALEKESIPNSLVRYIYELRAMVINGEYSRQLPVQVSDSALYTLEFIVTSPLEKLYTFRVSDQVLQEVAACVSWFREQYIDRSFHSLQVLESMIKFTGE